MVVTALVLAASLAAAPEREDARVLVDIAFAAAGGTSTTPGSAGFGAGISFGLGAWLNDTTGVAFRMTAATALFVGIVQTAIGPELRLNDHFLLSATVGASFTSISARGTQATLSFVAPIRLTWIFASRPEKQLEQRGLSVFVEIAPGVPLAFIGFPLPTTNPQFTATAVIGVGYSLR